MYIKASSYPQPTSQNSHSSITTSNFCEGSIIIFCTSSFLKTPLPSFTTMSYMLAIPVGSSVLSIIACILTAASVNENSSELHVFSNFFQKVVVFKCLSLEFQILFINCLLNLMYVNIYIYIYNQYNNCHTFQMLWVGTNVYLSQVWMRLIFREWCYICHLIYKKNIYNNQTEITTNSRILLQSFEFSNHRNTLRQVKGKRWGRLRQTQYRKS